jgi:SAM-dependent methyltransferase
MPGLMPAARIAASDIHPAACDFMREHFDIEVHQSAASPEQLNIGDPYDFIYVHSLFSHLPPTSFQRWLRELYAGVRPGGYLMVTANGDFARKKLPAEFLPYYDEAAGFGFRELVVDQPDLPSQDYGSMSISDSYFRDGVAAIDPSATIEFRSGVWLSHQDEWIIGKPATR